MIEHDAVIKFFNEVVAIAQQHDLLSGEHFSVEREVTLGADKGYDAKEFIDACVAMKVLPHVAQNTSSRASAVPHEMAQTEGYAISQRKRKLIEQGFGWAKTVGSIRQVMVRGLKRVDQMFVLTMAAYNLVRMRSLAQVRAQGAQ